MHRSQVAHPLVKFTFTSALPSPSLSLSTYSSSTSLTSFCIIVISQVPQPTCSWHPDTCQLGNPTTQSLLWLEGLSTRERNPTRGGLWLSFQRIPRISKTANAPCCGPGSTCSARAAPAASPRPTSSATTAQS